MKAQQQTQNIYNELIEEFIPHKFTKTDKRMKLPWTKYKSV